MSAATEPAAGPRFGEPGPALARAAQLLRESGFTADPVRAALGGTAPESVGPEDAAVYEGRIEGPPELAALVRLFVLEQPASSRALRQALGRGWRRLAEARLVAEESDVVRPQVRLVPFQGLLVASEPGHDNRDDPGRVLGVEPSTMTLANLTIRRPVTAALDLGTGCGVQGLLASRHARSVHAIDTSERFLRFAQLNAALNDASQLHLIHGDWYEPVQTDRFDLIVGNLPFAIAGEQESLFEHADEPWSDATSRKVLAGAPMHLADDGIAHFLCSWVVHDPNQWAAPISDWLAGSSCDVIVLRHGLEEAGAYAAARHRHLRAAQPDAFSERVETWRRAFRAHDVPWIAWGAISLRRRPAASNWLATFQDVGLPGPSGGDALAAMFEGTDFVSRLAGPQTLLDRRLTPAPEVRCAQVPAPVRSDPRELRYEVDIPAGAGIRVRIDDLTLTTLRRLAPAASLGKAIPEGVLEADTARIAAAFRELIASGLVTPHP